VECEPWIEAADLVGTIAYEAATPEQRESACRWASTKLWKAVKGGYGFVEQTVNACVPGTCGCCPCTCGPHTLIEVSRTLPIEEITSITNTRTNTVIDPSRYGIVNDRFVGLLGANDQWDAAAYCGAALQIVFLAGNEPDADAKEAARELASEWLMKETGVGTCRLVLKEFANKSVPRGRAGRRDVHLLGIPIVDLFVLENRPMTTSGMIDPSTLPTTVR